MEEQIEIPILGETVICSVLEDRYGGAYSDAQFTAFALPLNEVPHQVFGGDCECERFWHSGGENTRYLIGKGEIMEMAVADLYIQLLKQKVNRQ